MSRVRWIAAACLLASLAANAAEPGIPSTAVGPSTALSTASPRYPEEELRAGHEGTVVLKLHVNGNGRVAGSGVEKSSGYPALDQAALDAVRNWVFPMQKDAAGNATESDLRQEVTFKSGMSSEPKPEDWARELKHVMKLPCSRISEEAAAFRRDNPGKKPGEMQTFRETTVMLGLAASTQSMDARSEYIDRLGRAYPKVLELCAARPDAVFEQALAQALRTTP
jgi:TonB family protein